jgi:RND superfamily putative drug exporter
MRFSSHTRRRGSASVAGRLGAWSALHRGTAALIWLALLVCSILAMSVVSSKTLSDADSLNGDSARAYRVLDDAGFPRRASEQVLVQTGGGTSIHGSATRAAVGDLVSAIAATGEAQDIRSPFSPGNQGQFSADGRSAIVLFQMRGDADTASNRIDSVMHAVSEVADEHPQLRIEQFGDASAHKRLDETLGKDFRRAETSSIPITLLILWIAFGALVAALVPMTLALTAIVIATGLVAVVSHAVPTDDSAGSMILLIGLAVGVDYSLFYLRRAREERNRGASNRSAIAIAAATSGRAVLTSGLTVIVAMSAMFLTGQGTFEGMALATAVVVAVAMVGSLTVLPAMLSKLGDHVERGRIPFIGRRRSNDGESRIWRGIVRTSLRRPAVTAALAAVILVVLALPAVRLHTAVTGASDLPHSLPIMRTYDRIQRAFPGGPLPAQVVVTANDVRTPQMEQAVADLRRQALASGQMQNPITVDVNPSHTVLSISVPLAGDGDNARSQQALHTLRDSVVPSTVGTVGTAYVTGHTAASSDFTHQLRERTPWVITFVLGLAFVLLLVTFRSVVIPATAILLNLLSVAAAYGVLVAVFQNGWGGSLIGLDHSGPITAWLPLFLFVILFGLSMDYHVFILSRIREARDEGLSTRDAIVQGITHSAGVVTSAAVVMVAVFSTFATLSTISMKQIGVGLAAAVLLDATIVRGLLLPAVMGMLGEHNWYLPTWLDKVLGHRSSMPADRSYAAAAAGSRR